MALAPEQQFMEAVNGANHILVTFRKEWTPDAVAASLALARHLEKNGKRVDVVADRFALPKSLAFLPNASRIKPVLRQLRKLVISLDVSKTAVDELSYDVAGDKLRINITPKEGAFSGSDVSTAHSDFKYDLIVALDTPDYASLGTPFADHADFFYERPLVNIDHDPANERYGNMNHVDIAATSSCEALYSLLKGTGQHFLDADMATCLLTGIISKTRSFKTSSVTPKTLDIASELVAAGGRRDDIVHNLYRTRSIATLKLWGRALARLKFDPATKMAWSVLVRQDFIHAGAGEEDLASIIDELMTTAPEAEIFGLLYEQGSASVGPSAGTDTKPSEAVSGICALVSSEAHGNTLGLVSGLKPEGDRRTARLCFPGSSMLDAEKAVLGAISASLHKTQPALSPAVSA